MALSLVTSPSCVTTLEPTALGSSEDAGVIGADSGKPVAILAVCAMAELASNVYAACPEPLPYEAAVHDCSLRGGHLAAIGSNEENDWVASHARSVLNSNFWIGGTRDEEHVWRWPDGSVFWRGGRDGVPEGDAFVRWQPGEPNNASTVTADPERCLAITMDDNDWNDRVCSIRLPYVCEIGPAAP
jgi:hypothetical protein